MSTYQLIPAQHDWARFSDIYNRLTVFAPYTVPLSPRLIDQRLEPFCQQNETFCMIGLNEGEEGIIHASRYAGKWEVFGDTPQLGMIHMLFASHKRIACHLLDAAEAWFRERGLTRIHSCSWQQNPWQFILHGSEAYIWAGSYAAINAFRQLNYDIELDVVVMSLELPGEPQPSCPELPGFELKDTPGQDDMFARTGDFKAFIDGKQVGVCGYQYLKAISEHYKKGLGQIYISADSDLHGKGVGTALLTHAHQKLSSLGAQRVILVTNQSLFRAIKFYEKIGYQAEVIRGYWYMKMLE